MTSLTYIRAWAKVLVLMLVGSGLFWYYCSPVNGLLRGDGLKIEVHNNTASKIIVYIDSVDHNNPWSHPSPVFGGEVSPGGKTQLRKRNHNEPPYRYTYYVLIFSDGAWVEKEYGRFKVPSEISRYLITIEE